MSKMYRPLNNKEIAQLEARGCTAADWAQVQVSPGFRADSLSDVQLSGTVRLGVMEGTVRLLGDVEHRCGIRHARLHNVTVGDHCCIEHVHGHIANYTIGCDTLLSDVGTLAATGRSRFGNGVKVGVVDEAGSRPVVIHDRLSAAMAWLMVQASGRPQIAGALERMVEHYARSQQSDQGTIGHHVEIVGAGTLCDVRVADYCSVQGAACLVNGSIHGSEAAPSTVGHGVVAEDFIVCSGSDVDNGAQLHRVFVGQGCELGGAFTATDSLFFANCQMEHGEACAAFCGPYSVSHHRSTLLIAGMFSFMNAGSGSNQSNHAYKLGPIHYGLAERGVKLASDSYLLWPAAVGAFSVVSGRVTTHPDTRDLPFSLVSGADDTLTPGATLRSVGTLRDAAKWPRRDRRHEPEPQRLDGVHSAVFSPYTMNGVVRGLSVLRALRDQGWGAQKAYSYRGMKIAPRAIDRGIGLYRMALRAYIGRAIIDRLHIDDLESWDDVIRRLFPDEPLLPTTGEWVDMAGLLAPEEALRALVDDLDRGRLDSLEALGDRLHSLYLDYRDHEWRWVRPRLTIAFEEASADCDPYAELLHPTSLRLTPRILIHILEAWRQSEQEWLQWLLKDGSRDLTMAATAGAYFNDLPMLHPAEKQEADHPFLHRLQEEVDEYTKKADRITEILSTFAPKKRNR